MFADLGSTIKLCCEAEASLVWSKAQTALTLVPSSQQNGCLILSNVNRESAGKYTCRASNDFGFADATTEVIVRGDAYTLMQSQIFPFLSQKKEKKETLQELLVYELQLIIALQRMPILKPYGVSKLEEISKKILLRILKWTKF